MKQAAMAGAGVTTAAAAPRMFLEQAKAEDVAGKGSLKAHAKKRGILTGCAVDVALLRQDATYRSLLGEQYDILVGENCMKFGPTQPEAERYSFTDSDELMKFADEHGMKVRGHNFVWHEGLPGWFAGTATKENARKIMTDHIMTVGGRYKGRMQSWDVVNEAIWIADGRPDGLRSSSPWFELLGPEYLELAYRTAREADPKALLTYNEYGIEGDGEQDSRKRAATIELLRRLKAANVPLDALGVQSHLTTKPVGYGKGAQELMDAAKQMGLKVFITELDVADDSTDADDAAARDKAVAEVYREYLREMLRGPEVKAVLTWGASDGHTWLQGEKWRKKHPERKQRPLPFDEEYKPTEVFYALRESLDQAKSR